jgi:hypothetical protein
MIITKSGSQVHHTTTTMVSSYHRNKSGCPSITARSSSHEGLVYTTSSKYTNYRKFLFRRYNKNVYHHLQHHVIPIISMHASHPHCPKATIGLHCIVVLGQIGREPGDLGWRNHAKKVGALGHVVDEVDRAYARRHRARERP